VPATFVVSNICRPTVVRFGCLIAAHYDRETRLRPLNSCIVGNRGSSHPHCTPLCGPLGRESPQPAAGTARRQEEYSSSRSASVSGEGSGLGWSSRQWL